MKTATINNSFSKISSESKQIILEMSGPRPLRWVLQLLMNWFVIFLLIILSEVIDSWYCRLKGRCLIAQT